MLINESVFLRVRTNLNVYFVMILLMWSFLWCLLEIGGVGVDYNFNKYILTYFVALRFQRLSLWKMFFHKALTFHKLCFLFYLPIDLHIHKAHIGRYIFLFFCTNRKIAKKFRQLSKKPALLAFEQYSTYSFRNHHLVCL